MTIGVSSHHDTSTGTVTHIVVEPNGRSCAIIDSVLDYDAASGRTRTEGADAVIAEIEARGLTVEWILETHAHADHLSAARYMQARVGGRIGIGARITEVQVIFKEIFNLERTFNTEGGQFDHLFADGEVFTIGPQTAAVMFTPGHTPACVTYLVGDVAFVGDTLFMPDGGTARADFPGGNARDLYASIRKILELPAETRLFVCHDYAPGGRMPAWETTVAAERASNIHVGGNSDEESFVSLREARDKTLGMPTLLVPSIQINVRAGDMPPPEDNGVAYIKVPLNRL